MYVYIYIYIYKSSKPPAHVGLTRLQHQTSLGVL